MSLPRALVPVLMSLALPSCGLDTYGLGDPVTLSLGFSPVKQFDFSWEPASEGMSYRLLERVTKDGDYAQIGGDILGAAISRTMPLHLRFGASYLLRACDVDGQCTDSDPVAVIDSMAAAVGTLKADAISAGAWFGSDVALSADGDTLAVGAFLEPKGGAVYVFTLTKDGWTLEARLEPSPVLTGGFFGSSLALAADGNRLAVGANGEDTFSGAAYVFERVSGKWSQRARLQASNAAMNTAFGRSIALSGDGTILAVGSDAEASGDADKPDDTTAPGSGAAYVFEWVAGDWTQRAYLKASTITARDNFGSSVALSLDGGVLAVGAPVDKMVSRPGAVYMFTRSGATWSPSGALPGSADGFGFSVAVSSGGDTVVVGANREASGATGVGGEQGDKSAPEAGAAYVFERSSGSWAQRAYLKASNTGAGDAFGIDVAISSDGEVIAVGGNGEASAAVGVGGEQADDGAARRGAVYVFARSGGDWSQAGYVKAPDNASGMDFGHSLALSQSGETLAVGAWLENTGANGSGAVYLY